MRNRFTQLLNGNQGNNGNNNNNNNANNNTHHQLAKLPLLAVALLKEGKIPNWLLSLPIPIAFWETPVTSADNTIGSYLTSRDNKVLSQTHPSFYLLYSNEVEGKRNRINTLFSVNNNKPYDSKNLRKLLSHAAVGEWEQAEAIWRQDPSLLTRSGTVYFPNRIYQQGKAPIDISVWQNPGRPKLTGTPWQIAMMNAEFEEAEKMGRMMTFDEKQRQFFEIFPTGKIENDQEKFEKAEKLLDALFSAVIEDDKINENNLEKMNEKTHLALSDLYTFLTPLSSSEHKTGLVFDVNIYIHALKLYEEKFSQFQNWEQRSFWCIRIEEYIAALLPTSYLRPHAQGIGNTENGESLKRDGCKLKDGTPYFAFRRSSDSIPAVHHFVGYYGGRCAGREGGGGHWRTWIFSKLMSSKNEIRDKIMQQYSRSAASSLTY